MDEEDKPPSATWRDVTVDLREQRKRPSSEWSEKLWDIIAAAPNDAGAQYALAVIDGVFSLDQYNAFVHAAGLDTGLKLSRFKALAAGFEGVAQSLLTWRAAKAETKSPARRKEKLDHVANSARELVEALGGLDKWHQWSIFQASRSVRRLHEDGGIIKDGRVNLKGFGLSSSVDVAPIFAFLTDPYYAETLCQSARLAPSYVYPIHDADVRAIKGLAQLTGLPLTRNSNLIALGECFFLEIKKAIGDDPDEDKPRHIEDLIDRAKLLP